MNNGKKLTKQLLKTHIRSIETLVNKTKDDKLGYIGRGIIKKDLAELESHIILYF